MRAPDFLTVARVFLLSASGAVVAVCQADDEALVRAFLEEQIGALSSRSEVSVVVDWELVRRTTLHSSEIERRWNAVEGYPDHPDRPQVEYHRQLLRHPEHVTGTVHFAGAEAWAVQESRDTGYRFRAGGTPHTRWMLASRGDGGQLTITREGVPFPALYNVSRFYDLTRERVSLLLFHGLGTLSADAPIVSLDVADGHWIAEISDQDRDIHAEGYVDGAPRSVTLVRVRIEPKGSSILPEEYHFQDHVHEHVYTRTRPRTITADRTDDIRDTYTVARVATVRPALVLAAASVPEPAGNVRTVDFSKPDSEFWLRYAGSARVTWRRRGGEDRFHVDPATTAVGSLMGAPEPSALADHARVIAFWLALLAVVAVPLIFYRLRRH